MVQLFNRSQKDAEGWAKVSGMVWPLVADLPAELFEIEGNATEGRIRASAIGRTVIPYL
jgi:hypothetical protein